MALRYSRPLSSTGSRDGGPLPRAGSLAVMTEPPCALTPAGMPHFGPKSVRSLFPGAWISPFGAEIECQRK